MNSDNVFIVLRNHMDEHGEVIDGVFSSELKAEDSIDEGEPFCSYRVVERYIKD